MAKARKRRSKAGKIIFVIEIVVLVLLIGALAAYSFVNSKLNKIENDTLDMNKVQINNAGKQYDADRIHKSSTVWPRQQAGGVTVRRQSKQ